MDICTIIASNYVAFARVLAESFREHHPDGRVFVLVIDDRRGRHRPGRRAVRGAHARASSASRALRPHGRALQRARALDGGEAVAAAAPAQRARAARRSPTWTPTSRSSTTSARSRRCCASTASWSRRTSPRRCRATGASRARPTSSSRAPTTSASSGSRPAPAPTSCSTGGASGWRPTASSRPSAATSSTSAGWTSRPASCPTSHVLRDPGYNVAYWNLPSARGPPRAASATRSNGRPLRFFHYSGFDPRAPRAALQAPGPHPAADEPALRELCARYADAAARRGHRARPRDWTLHVRRARATARRSTPRCGARTARGGRGGRAGRAARSPPRARTTCSTGSTAPGRGRRQAPGSRRYLAALHAGRPDLQRGFPDLGGDGRPRGSCVGATCSGARRSRSRRRCSAQAPRRRAARRRRLGVNVAGYFRSVLGVGEAGRQVIAALRAAGSRSPPVGLERRALAAGPRSAPTPAASRRSRST